jgi:hypothetical protein
MGGAELSGKLGQRPSAAFTLTLAEWLLGGCLLGLAALLAAAPIACTDFFWHLMLGQIILRDLSIPGTDLFSAVHPDAAYVQPQWLWEVLAAAVHAVGGLYAVRLLSAVLMLLSFAALYLTTRRLSRQRSLGLLCTALGLCLFVDRFRARPDALSLGFFALSLPLLIDPLPRSGQRRTLYAFGLALAWANLHGGASVLLLLSMGALSVGNLIDRRRGLVSKAELARCLRLLLATVAGLSLSPTLIPGLLHWSRLIGAQIDTGNEEWLPTYTILRYGAAPQTLLTAALPTLIALGYVAEQLYRTRQVSLARGTPRFEQGRAACRSAEWLLACGYLVLSQLAVRNAFLCLLPVVFMLRRAGARGFSRRAAGLASAGACALALIVAHDVFVRSLGGIGAARALYRADLMPNTYPEQAGAFLEGARIEGGIFNEGQWGGYLIERCYPACHVFVDTRQNLTPEMWRVFLASRSAAQRPHALEYAFRTWGVELAVFRGPTFPLIVPPPTWQLLFKAGDQEVYQHLGGAHAAGNLARTRAFLRVGADADLALAATRVGAQVWLSSPTQRGLEGAAEVEIASASPTLRQHGHAAMGELLYRAGLYPRALAHFSAAEQLGPVSTSTLYFHALSCFAAGEHAALVRLIPLLERRDERELSPRQRERLDLLRAALGRAQGS